MGKILIIVSVVITLLTAVLGFVNKGKLSDMTTRATTAESEASKSKATLKTTSDTLATTKKTLDTTTAEKEALTSQVATATSDAEKAKKDASDAQAQLTTLKTDNEKALADLAAVTKERDDLKGNSNPTPGVANSEVAELKTRVEEANTLVTKLQQENNEAKTKLAELQKKEGDRVAGILKKGTEGRILAVNPAWNFVVLSIGDKQGIASNTELLVKRGGQLVGKVRVTSVEPSSSIADIVANSVPHGTVISPGDHVIYQASQD